MSRRLGINATDQLEGERAVADMKDERGRCWVTSEDVTLEEEYFLEDFLIKVEKIMSGFDPDHLKKLVIQFETEYEEYSVRMSLGHWRPETDVEMNTRVNDAASRLVRMQSAQETKERAILKALQEKYGA